MVKAYKLANNLPLDRRARLTDAYQPPTIVMWAKRRMPYALSIPPYIPRNSLLRLSYFLQTLHSRSPGTATWLVHQYVLLTSVAVWDHKLGGFSVRDSAPARPEKLGPGNDGHSLGKVASVGLASLS
jgi:hypothetical protein